MERPSLWSLENMQEEMILLFFQLLCIGLHDGEEKKKKDWCHTKQSGQEKERKKWQKEIIISLSEEVGSVDYSTGFWITGTKNGNDGIFTKE